MRAGRRYISVYSEAEVDVDLFDIIEDIVDLYNSDREFRDIMNQKITKSDETEYTLDDFIQKAKMIRKDEHLWNRVKHDLKEIVKDDYVVVL